MANDIYQSSAVKKRHKLHSKDFNSFRSNLIEYAKSYFSSTYRDFSENSTGMMFIELASYVARCTILLY